MEGDENRIQLFNQCPSDLVLTWFRHHLKVKQNTNNIVISLTLQNESILMTVNATAYKNTGFVLKRKQKKSYKPESATHYLEEFTVVEISLDTVVCMLFEYVYYRALYLSSRILYKEYCSIIMQNTRMYIRVTSNNSQSLTVIDIKAQLNDRCQIICFQLLHVPIMHSPQLFCLAEGLGSLVIFPSSLHIV